MSGFFEIISILFWPTVAVVLTIAIFSFVFKDNPLYKFAEHLFTGLSVGYLVVVSYKNVIIPKMWVPLSNYYSSKQFGMFIFILTALFMGLLFLSRFSAKHVWLSRFPMSIYIGFYSGYAIVATFRANVMQQLYGTVIDLNTNSPVIDGAKFKLLFADFTMKHLIEALNGPIFVFGVLIVLIYFFFSLRHDNIIVKASMKPALFYIMLAFGAAFGYTFMGRISLFIGRMNYIFVEWYDLVRNTIGG